MAKINSKLTHKSGIPLGGIGSGTVEIKPDGSLKEWQILNKGRWISNDDNYLKENLKYELGSDYMPFYIRVKDHNGEIKVRRLSLDVEEKEFRNVMFSWLKCIPEIDYDGKFSCATLNYNDPTLPVEIKSTFFSPFIPHDSKISGTPGFYVEFNIENRSDKEVDISLLSKIKNPINLTQKNRELVNHIIKNDTSTTLYMSSNSQSKDATNGSFCADITGSDVGYICADYSGYLDTYIPYGDFGVTQQSMLFDFRRDGKLINSNSGEDISYLLKDNNETIDKYSESEIDSILKKLDDYAFFYPIKRRLMNIDATIFDTREGKLEVLKYIKCCLDTLDGEERDKQQFGDGALCSRTVLQPGESKEIRLTVSWHFPNHYGEKDIFVGHMYDNWYSNALEVNKFMVDNYDIIKNETFSFSDNIYNSSLDDSYIESWAGQLTTIKKSSYWTKDNKFAIWEGLGSCGLHTTDITYQGSFPLIAMFSDLQLNQMELGASYQRDDGRVHHCFKSNMCEVDNGFLRVDMNPQFILLIYRDYLYTGDKQYLKRMWKHIVLAMNSFDKLDIDNDGLPDADTNENTYDAWQFEGTPSYISSLWIACLASVIKIAEELNEDQYKNEWSEKLDKAKQSFESKLWNGEYYNLWKNNNKTDSCCMTDQIDGEWFLRSIGLDSQLPDDRISQVLDSIFKYNYSEEGGLINASYPKDSSYTLYTYENLQGLCNWTGIEYLISALMIYNGKYIKAEKIVKNIIDRYSRLGRIWNHEECGDHYFRACSSWTILLAITGMSYDIPSKSISINPSKLYNEFTAPFVCTTCWGTVDVTKNSIRLIIKHGCLELKNINSKTYTNVNVNSNKIESQYKEEKIIFDKNIILNKNDIVELTK